MSHFFKNGKEAAQVDLDLFQRLLLAGALFWKLLLPVFIYYTCINIQCKWVLCLVFELLLWSLVMKLRKDMMVLLYLYIKVWNSASYACPALTRSRSICCEGHDKLLCIACLTLPFRLTASSWTGSLLGRACTEASDQVRDWFGCSACCWRTVGLSTAARVGVLPSKICFL